MNVTLKPVGGRLLILPDEQEREAAKLILREDTRRRIPLYGTVVEVSEDSPSRKMQCKPGDRVCYQYYVSNEMMVDEKPHIIMLERDLLFIVEK